MTIENPWHSRPIDVHRWSEHKEVGPLVARLWHDHFSDFEGSPSRSGPKPKSTYKSQFRALLLDLYVAWKTDPELSIGVPMSSNGWNANSRYNALNLSKKMIPIIDRAHEVGLVDLAKGSFSGPYGFGNRNTRIRAAEPLCELFREAHLPLASIGRHPDQECIILKKGDKEDEYEDTHETVAMRARLRRYNELLARTFIDIPSLEEPVVERRVEAGVEEGQTNRVLVSPSQKFVRRIFSRGSWVLNGRFYGPWWQQLGSDWRRQIFINDAPTVEVDFQGLHIHLLATRAGETLRGDPYAFPRNTVPRTPKSLQRKIIKTLLLKAINARDKKSAFSSFRQDWCSGHMAKRLSNHDLSRLLEVILEKHPFMRGKLCNDYGIELMYLDSQITDHVLSRATWFNLPVLGVHDSFIVDFRRVRGLKLFMSLAAQDVVGVKLPVKTSDPEAEELPPNTYLASRQVPRTQGYTQRLTDHVTQHGPLAEVRTPR